MLQQNRSTAFTGAPVAPFTRPPHHTLTAPRRPPLWAARMTVAPPLTPSPPEAFTADPVTLLPDVASYLSTLEAHRDKLIVLKIFAPWCRSCRALTPKVNRLAREYKDVVFVKINYEENKELCWRIGVTAMPTFVFYWGEAGEVDKFSCGPQRAGILREKIEDCVRGRCLLEGIDEETV